MRVKRSFFDWCIENDRMDLIERWDYNLNKVSPQEANLTYPYYFKCPREIHDSELRKIRNVIQPHGGSTCSKCNSFAQYLLDEFGESGIDTYWGIKNTLSPWEIPACSGKIKIFIKCLEKEYHEEYETIPATFKYGHRCPYCRGNKVHPFDSFAQYCINLYGNDFLSKYWEYEKNNKIGIDPYFITPFIKVKVYIFCQKCDYHSSYKISPLDFNNDVRCPYCKKIMVHPNDSLGTKLSQSISTWSLNNTKTPYDYSPKSSKIVKWKCENNIHVDYERRISESVQYEFRCPECSRERYESILQEKIRTYVNDNYEYTLKHERNCTIVPHNPKTDYPMPFDNEIVELKLICECHGEQHYSTNAYKSLWNNGKLTPEQQLAKRQQYDEYKKQYALSQGYHYLEIPYWAEKNDQYKKLIDDKIIKILTINETA